MQRRPVHRDSLGREAAETDTLYLNLAGSAQLGFGLRRELQPGHHGPGQVESTITLGVVDDGFNEGIETAEITYEYINGCGELISTTSLVVIVDPIPIEAIPAIECQTLDGEQELGYTGMVGYGPFNYEWAGDSGATPPWTPVRGPRRLTRCLS